MDKEELISRLRTLEESLPGELSENENARKVMANSSMYFQKYLDKLEESDLKENEYDEIAVEKEEDRRDSLLDEESDLRTNLLKSESYFNTLSREIEELEERASGLLPERILKYEEVINGYDIQYSKATTDEEREYISKKRGRRQEELETIRENRETLLEEIKDRRARLAEIEENLNRKREEIERISSEIREVENRISALKNTSMSEEEKQRLELDTQALYRMSRFFTANPKEEINRIIYDFEEGRITENEVNDKLQNLRSLLSSGLYETSDLKAKLSPEAVLAKREETEEKIKAYEEKLADESWYLDRTPEYDENINRILAYNQMVERIKEDKVQLETERTEREQELEENNSRILIYENWLSKSDKEKERITKSTLPDSLKEALIKEEDLKIESYTISRESLINKNQRINDRNADYEREMYIANTRINKYESKVEEARKNLYFLNETEREKDEQELEELETLLLSTYLEGSVLENSYDEELDNLINLTGGRKIVDKDDEYIPTFVANFTPEQRKMYDDILAGLTPEEKKEVESELEKKVEETSKKEPVPVVASEKDKDPSIAYFDNPDEEEEKDKVVPLVDVKDGPKVKVRKFKDIAKEKLEKIKVWWNTNKKKILRIGGIVAVAAVLLSTVKCSSNKKQEVSVKEPTAVVQMDLAEDEEEKIEDELEVTPPEIDDNKTPKPTEPAPDPVNPPVIPPVEPPVIPPVEPPVFPPVTPPEEVVEDVYILDTEAPTNTGDSLPADENTPYLQGESVYNPITNTWIDSHGNKISQHEDGSFSVEVKSEEVEQVDEDTNKITNPDMTPVEKEITEEPNNEIITPSGPVEETPVSYEEAVKDGTLSEAEAQEYQNFFDEMFAGMEEEQSEGLGR